MNPKIDKNFLRSVVFIAATIIIFIGLEKLFFNNKVQLPFFSKMYSRDKKIKDVDILFISDSTVHVFDVVVLSKLFKKEMYSIACAGLPMTVILEDLKIILKYTNPKIIVLGLPTLNSSPIIGGLALNNLDNMQNYFDKLSVAYSLFAIDRIPEAMFQLLRYSSTWSRWSNLNFHKPLKQITQNEYSYLESIMMGRGNRSRKAISRSLIGKNIEQLIMDGKNKLNKSNLEANLIALQNIIELAQKNNIELWMYQPPIVDSFSLEDLVWLESDILKLGYIKYFDNLYDKTKEIGLVETDYASFHHQNRNGIMKITNYYIPIIKSRTGWEIFNDNIFAYNDESIEKIGDNKWRYIMKNMQKDVWYRFELIDNKAKNKNNRIIKTQEFSKQNYFDCEVSILDNPQYSVIVVMLPAGTTNFDKQTIQTSGISLSFMKYGNVKLN